MSKKHLKSTPHTKTRTISTGIQQSMYANDMTQTLELFDKDCKVAIKKCYNKVKVITLEMNGKLEKSENKQDT